MWPFGNNDGCGNHHFDEYEEADDFKVKERTFIWDSDGYHGWSGADVEELEDWGYRWVNGIAVLRKKVRECQHQGCDEEETTWSLERVIPLDSIEEIGMEYDEFKEEYPKQ